MNGFRVKPLEWTSVSEFCTRETALALGGSYNIVMLDGDDGPPSLNFDLGGMLTFRFVLEPDPLGLPGERRPKQFRSVAEAKAFAQADYEARILSALAPSATPACGPVEIPEGWTEGPWLQSENDPCFVYALMDDDHQSSPRGRPRKKNRMWAHAHFDRSVPEEERKATGALLLAAPTLAARVRELEGEVERLRAVETRAAGIESLLAEMTGNAETVMRYLAEHGARVIGHLLDSDDNPGQRLRDDIAEARALANTEDRDHG